MQPVAEPANDLSRVHALMERVRARLAAAIRGRDDVIELILTALLADGHVLLEDYPGSGKTILSRALGEALRAEEGDQFAPFRRIQFTPDLLPSDVTGTAVFEPETGRFAFRPGPIFAHVVLADEINRTSPKVQAAMLEAMAEKQVTSDNTSYRLDELFFVIATQNPLDLAGTYPLPKPQLDRFLFKIRMQHIAREDELQVLAEYPTPRLQRAAELPGVTRDELVWARSVVREQVALDTAVRGALVDIARRLRDDPRVLQGVSTRALMLMLPALQSRAVLHQRDYVGPQDVEALVTPVLHHRIDPAPGVTDVDAVLREACAPEIEKLSRMSLR